MGSEFASKVLYVVGRWGLGEELFYDRQEVVNRSDGIELRVRWIAQETASRSEEEGGFEDL